MPVNLGALGIKPEHLPAILERSMKNFNADPKREFLRERDALQAALCAACG
jgi:hypothetical protein